MIELVVVMCTLDQPSRCKDVHLTFEENSISVRECLMKGQFEMARWVGEHSGWVVGGKWKCQPVGLEAKL